MVDPIPPEKWEEHKGEILRLYIYEDLPLKHVMKRVRTRDFHPDESQYRSKLKTWRQRKARKSRKARHKPTENAPEQTLNSAHLLQPWEQSRELRNSLRSPDFNNLNQPDPNWGPVPSPFQPSGTIEPTATDPHPENSYSDPQLFHQIALRKSVADASQSGPGPPRVERAVRQRPSVAVGKGLPPTNTQNPYVATLNPPGPFGSTANNPFEQYNPHVLQYPPTSSEPDFGWWP